jgi:hypothetical protein
MTRNPPPPRWRRALVWLGIVVVVGAILGMVGFGPSPRSGPAPATAASPPAALATLARTAVADVPPAAAPAPPAPARTDPAAPGPASAWSQLAAPAAWDLCGIGRVPVPLGRRWGFGFPTLPSALGEAPLTEALEAAWLRLSDTALATPREQAAAWRLVRFFTDDPALRVEAKGALHHLARASGDPVIHAWALTHCGTPQQPCDAELLAAWRAAEPGNLTPWLITWEQAPKDRAAAWAGIAQTTHFHRYDNRWPGMIDAALPEGTPAYLRWMVSIPLIGIEAAVWVPYLSPDSALCSWRGEPDAAERARCDTVARVAAAGSDDPLGLGLAIRLGRRAGWPAETLQALQAEADRLHAAWQTEDPPQPQHQPLACTAVEPWLALNVRRAAVGDREALRERADARGLPPAPAWRLPDRAPHPFGAAPH